MYGRYQLNLVLQVLTGHCNLQKHRKTMGRARISICPKCGKEEETPDHYVGRCSFYQGMRIEYLNVTTTTIRNVVELSNINKLVSYLVQTGRLTEYDLWELLLAVAVSFAMGLLLGLRNVSDMVTCLIPPSIKKKNGPWVEGHWGCLVIWGPGPGLGPEDHYMKYHNMYLLQILLHGADVWS